MNLCYTLFFKYTRCVKKVILIYIIYFFWLEQLVKNLSCTTVGIINNAKSSNEFDPHEDVIERLMDTSNLFQLPAAVLDSSMFRAARCMI